MRIVKESWHGEPKLFDLKNIRGDKVKIKRGTRFAFEATPAYTPDKNKVVEWELFTLFLVLSKVGQRTVRIELDVCLDPRKLPRFAVSHELLTSLGISGAIEVQANRTGKLVVYDEGDAFSFDIDIGTFQTNQRVPEREISSFLKSPRSFR